MLKMNLHLRLMTILTVLLLLLLTACSAPTAPTTAAAPGENAPSASWKPGDKKIPLVIFNWGEYISESNDTIDYYGTSYSVKNVLKVFEERYPQYEVSNHYLTFDDNEKMYAKLMTQSYDLIVPSDYMVVRLIKEGKLQPLKQELLPTVGKHLDPDLKNIRFDPDAAQSAKVAEYAVPYLYCTVGLVYNRQMVGELHGNDPKDIWSVLFDPKFKGKIGMYNSMRESIGATLNYQGHSLNTTDPAELEQAKKLLIEQRKTIKPLYGIDDLKDKFVSGELAAGVAWSGDHVVIQQRVAEGDGDIDNIGFILPRGSNFSVDMLCIPANAKNAAGAHAFIDFLYDPDIALMNAVYTGYSSPNMQAIAQLPESIAKNPSYYPDAETMKSLEIYYSSETIDTTYNSLWEAVLAN